MTGVQLRATTKTMQTRYIFFFVCLFSCLLWLQMIDCLLPIQTYGINTTDYHLVTQQQGGFNKPFNSTAKWSVLNWNVIYFARSACMKYNNATAQCDLLQGGKEYTDNHNHHHQPFSHTSYTNLYCWLHEI